MKRTAVFPGSFDPMTRGHEDIVLRAIPIFDKIIVAVGNNSEKKSMFNIEDRMAWASIVFKDHPSVEVQKFTGLTIDFCRKVNANYLLRGLRTSADFEFERSIGQMNKNLNEKIETVFLLTSAKYTALNSSIVRDILRHGGNVDQFIPLKLKGKVHR